MMVLKKTMKMQRPESSLFGIYVHWPYCASKCPYCDFNSHVRPDIDHEAWRKAYRKEIEYYAGLTKGRTVTSVFFGGGTPSLMEPETTAMVIDTIAGNWDVADDVEITLEANPTSIEISKFQGFRTAGVNRVSVGIQSLRDDVLKFLGREHSAVEALEALKTARSVFDRFSFDLMYARPEQTRDEWREELSEALEHAEGHMSLYQLTIEQGTPFFLQHKRGEFIMPDDDKSGAFYEDTQEMMVQAGLPLYEVSNHAAEGMDSKHNMTYWRYRDYVGIGPGAHGRLTLDGEKQATRGHRAPDIWMEKVEQQGHGGHPFEPIKSRQRFTEALMMGLRLAEGVSLTHLSEEGGCDWQDNLDPVKLRKLQDEGLLLCNDNALKPTVDGLQRLNAMLSYLL